MVNFMAFILRIVYIIYYLLYIYFTLIRSQENLGLLDILNFKVIVFKKFDWLIIYFFDDKHFSHMCMCMDVVVWWYHDLFRNEIRVNLDIWSDKLLEHLWTLLH